MVYPELPTLCCACETRYVPSHAPKPSSATGKAALGRWSAKAIRLLPRLVGRDIPPRRLSHIQLSVADWATAKESARTTRATGSTA